MQPGYYDFITQTFSTATDTYTGNALVGISLIEIGLMFSKIHPGSTSDFGITEKNLMWLERRAQRVCFPKFF